jgi:hypothetical protein
MRIHTGRLLLTPSDPLLAVDPATLHDALGEIGFIGDPLTRLDGNCPASQHFLAGKHFLSLLAFAGCSVNLSLDEPGDGSPFTHVRLLGPLAAPLLLHGRNTRPPRCPLCRALHRDWARILKGHPNQHLTCPACGSSRPSWDWDWKDKAGYGRSFVWVEEVFPGEAEPTPSLLAALEATTTSPWQRFYVQD